MIDFGVTERKASELYQRMKNCRLSETDLEERFIRGSGPGGQKINKTATCVYLKHKPTCLEVKIQKTRSQSLNRFYARRRMCELLEERLSPQTAPETINKNKIRKQKDRRKRRRKSKKSN